MKTIIKHLASGEIVSETCLFFQEIIPEPVFFRNGFWKVLRFRESLPGRFCIKFPPFPWLKRNSEVYDHSGAKHSSNTASTQQILSIQWRVWVWTSQCYYRHVWTGQECLLIRKCYLRHISNIIYASNFLGKTSVTAAVKQFVSL